MITYLLKRISSENESASFLPGISFGQLTLEYRQYSVLRVERTVRLSRKRQEIKKMVGSEI